MSVGLVIFRRLACGDMVRNALKGHRNLQPIARDDRTEVLLARLSEAEMRKKANRLEHPEP